MKFWPSGLNLNENIFLTFSKTLPLSMPIFIILNDDQVLQTKDFEKQQYCCSYQFDKTTTKIQNWYKIQVNTIYRTDTKWGLELVSHVLLAQMTWNFVRYVRLTKQFHQWRLMTVT